MGNCGACCGKADTNEIITEKQQKQKGVHSGNEVNFDNKRATKYVYIHVSCFNYFVEMLADQMINMAATLTINSTIMI